MRKSILQTIILFFSLWPLYAAKVVSTPGIKCYVLPTTTKSGKVLDVSASNETIISTAESFLIQPSEFIPVAGKTDTYYSKAASFTFVAPGNNCFVGFEIHPISTDNFRHCIENMILTRQYEAHNAMDITVSSF